MKYIFSITFVALLFFVWYNQVFALTALSSEDLSIVTAMKTNILADTDNGRDLSWLTEWYYIIKETVDSSVNNNVATNRLQWLLLDLRNLIDTKKQSSLLSKQTIENNFLSTYQSWLYYSWYIVSILPDACYTHYNMVDDIARAENIPMSLVMATWKMESGCGFYYPDNGDWPFQMLYKNITWTMTISKMVNEIQDFAAFTRNKWEWYNTSNVGSWLTIWMSYTGRDLTGVVMHWALYNGLSGASIKWYVQPANPNYVWWRYTEMYSGANKDGLLSNMLKVIRDRR